MSKTDSIANIKEMAALITGAGRGIGYELARRICENGGSVYAVVRNPQDVINLESKFPGSLKAFCCDITQADAESRLQEFLSENCGALNLLINNAGYGASSYGIEGLKFDELESVLSVHLYGAIRCVRAALPYLKEAAPAVVLNISSRFASSCWVAEKVLSPAEATYAYRIAKASMNMLSACLAAEFDPEQIRVLAVDPGKVKTRFGPKDADMEPDAAAAAILELASKNTGTGLFVNSAGEQLPW